MHLTTANQDRISGELVEETAHARSESESQAAGHHPAGVGKAICWPRHSPSWQRERRELLQRIFAGVHRQRARGVPVRRALRAAARRWRGRFYRTAPDKRIPFSQSRLTALYYAWLRAGKNTQPLQLCYTTRRVPRSLIDELLRGCAAPDVMSISAACRNFAAAPFSPRSLALKFSARQRAAVRSLHRARRNALGLQRQLEKSLSA